MNINSTRAVSTALILGVTCTAEAAVLEWPSAGCSGTLQACIDAAAPGDTVRVVTLATIDEDLSLFNRSVTLTARGHAARFADGRRIQVTANVDGVSTRLENLWVGQVNVLVGSANAAHTQTVVMENLRVTTVPTVGTGVSILANSSVQSSYTVTLHRSRVDVGSGRFGAVEFQHLGNGGQALLNLTDNQINANWDGIYGILGGGNSLANIQNNRIGRYRDARAGILSYGIYVRNQSTASAANRVNAYRNVVFQFSRGIEVSHGTAGNLSAWILNNTLAQLSEDGIAINRDPSLSLSGRVANNIVDLARACGLLFFSGAGGLTADYNMYTRTPTGVCGGTLGANDILPLNPGFVGSQDFRLTVSSPARNSGNNADQPAVLVPLPDFDRRAGRVGVVDRGAFEFDFELSHEHRVTASNQSANLTQVTGTPFSLVASDRLQLGQFGRDFSTSPPLPSGSSSHLGVWYNGSVWTIFNQVPTLPAPAIGRRFFVLNNLSSNTNILAVSNAGNTSGHILTLDHSALNNTPEALPIVTQVFDPDGDEVGTYNNSAVGVWYNPSTNRWTVFNQVPVSGPVPPIAAGAAFHVMVPNRLFAEGSHAYRTPTLTSPVGVMFLDHPLLNNNACAHPYVTSVYNPNNVYVPSNLLVSYNSFPGDGRAQWGIERGDGQQIPAGAAFHVYIDVQQSRRCQDEALQGDGFE